MWNKKRISYEKENYFLQKVNMRKKKIKKTISPIERNMVGKNLGLLGKLQGTRVKMPGIFHCQRKKIPRV